MKSALRLLLLGSGLLACRSAPPPPPPASPATTAPAEAAAPPKTTVKPGVPRREVGNLVFEGVPVAPPELAGRIRRYQNVRSASLVGWSEDGKSIYLLTRFGSTTQLHRVDRPLGARHQLTFFDEPLGQVVVGPRGSGLILVKDVGGNEYSQLYAFDEATGTARMLTDGKSSNRGPRWSNDGRNVAFSSTARNGKDFDLWIVDPKSGERRIAYEGEGLWMVLDWSPDDERLLVRHYISATKSELMVVEPSKGVVHDLTPKVGDTSFDAAVFSQDGRRVFYVSDLGGEHKRLIERDLASGEDRVISKDVPWGVEDLARSPDRRTLAMSFNEGGFSRLALVDARRGRRLASPRLPKGILRNLHFSPDGRKLAFRMESPSTPGDIYALDLSTRTLTRWTESETGGLPADALSRVELFDYPTFDARKIPALAIRPPGKGPFPVVIVIHGGPESQSRPYFSTYNALLVGALRAAVIRPNVRGSTGYGRSYTLLDNGMKREDSVKDIGALLDWIKTQPDLDANRVALFGGSYGGYMVLAGGVHYSDRVRALVDIVGISSFVTFLESTKEYRRDLRRPEYGDERIPEMRAHLEAISPLTNAERIRAPLFVIQGLNDPRVPATESRQVVERVRAGGKDVWYMLAKDEGHGFRKKPNRDAMLAAIYMFLQRHLLAPDM